MNWPLRTTPRCTVTPGGPMCSRIRNAVFLFGVLGGCEDSSSNQADVGSSVDTEPVLVLAASDLQLALAEVAVSFQVATGDIVSLVFGSTGNLATQIQNGAPADVFFAADQSFLDRLDAAGMIESDSRVVYAVGR